jgi:sugar lactone lactonase YvrE
VADPDALTVVVGTGREGFSGDGGRATVAELRFPRGVAVDPGGNLFIADWGNHRVRRVDAETGVITTVAGTVRKGFSGDGGPATSAELRFPFGVAVDGAGNLFIADSGNHRIRRVDAGTGIITTVAGTGDRGFQGDGGSATRAQLAGPQGLVVDGTGNLFIADRDNSRVRRVDAATGVITTVAGTSVFGFSGDGGPATNAQIMSPGGVAVDRTGNLFIADTGNDRIRRVDWKTGVITTVAEPTVISAIQDPQGVAVDGAGNLYIANLGNHLIRRVDAVTGSTTTVAGPDAPGGLKSPHSVAVSPDGFLFIADTDSHRILRVGIR